MAKRAKKVKARRVSVFQQAATEMRDKSAADSKRMLELLADAEKVIHELRVLTIRNY